MELLHTTLLRVEENTNKIASAKIMKKVTMPIAISDEEEACPVGDPVKDVASKVCQADHHRRYGDDLCSSSHSLALSGVNLTRNMGVAEMPPPLLIGRPTMMLYQPSFRPPGYLVKNGSIRGHGKSRLSTHFGIVQRVGLKRNFSSYAGVDNDSSGNMVKVFGSVIKKFPSQLLIGSKNLVTHVNPNQMKLPPENSLTEPQRWAANYAFDTQKNLLEELLSLIPSTILVDNIFHMFVMMLTKYNDCMEEPTFWCLPPSFSTDLRQGKSGKQLVVDYSKTWMKPSLTLTYVYLPIKEDSRHWYLMLIAFREGMLYYLDASMGEVEALKQKSFVRKLGDDVVTIIAESTYEEDFSTKVGYITCSGVVVAMAFLLLRHGNAGGRGGGHRHSHRHHPPTSCRQNHEQSASPERRARAADLTSHGVRRRHSCMLLPPPIYLAASTASVECVVGKGSPSCRSTQPSSASPPFMHASATVDLPSRFCRHRGVRHREGDPKLPIYLAVECVTAVHACSYHRRSTQPPSLRHPRAADGPATPVASASLCFEFLIWLCASLLIWLCA
ncbi:hypothetical protein AHAS_Ahas03G0186700 [Arachis hypogaea]